MMRFRYTERGSTLVEFAIVIIMLLMVIFGIVDFGRVVYAYHFVGNAAREGTRFAMVRGAKCSAWASACPAQPSDIETFVQNSAVGIGLDPNSISVTPIFPVPGGGEQPAGCVLSIETGLYDEPGCYVQVQVQYAFNFIFPLMPRTDCTIEATGRTVHANICMKSTSQMLISQ